MVLGFAAIEVVRSKEGYGLGVIGFWDMRCVPMTASDTVGTPASVRRMREIMSVDLRGRRLLGLWLPPSNADTFSFVIDLSVVLWIRDISITAKRNR